MIRILIRLAFFKNLLISLLLVFGFFFAIAENASAQLCCYCNWSYCVFGGQYYPPVQECFSPNPNSFYGAQYPSSMVNPDNGLTYSCSGDDTCWAANLGGPNPYPGYYTDCKNCPLPGGYGINWCEGGLASNFQVCAENCGSSSECYGVSDRGCGCGGSEEIRQYSQWCDATGWRYWCETPSSDHPCNCEVGNGLRIVESNYTNESNRSVSYRRTDVVTGGVNRGVISDDINSGNSCTDANGDVYRTYGGLIPHQTSASPRGNIYLSAGTYEFMSSGCKSGRICMADPCYENWCYPHEGVSLAVNNTWLIGNSTTYINYGGTNTPWTTNNCEPESIPSSQITIPVSGWYSFEFNARYLPRYTSTLSYRPVGTGTWLPITYDMLSSCGSLTPPNTPPTCSISGPISAIATYPITYHLTGSDPDSNLSSITVKYSLTSNPAGFATISVPGVTPTGYDGNITIPGLASGVYYIGCEAQDSLSAQCYSNPWCSGCTTDCGANDYLTLTVGDYINPWFQVIGGNVVAKLGVSSPIPATAYNTDFIRDPVGLLIHNGSLSLGTANTAGKPIVNATTISKPEATFDLFFNKKLPQEIKTAITLDMAGCNSHLGCAYNSNTISLNSLTGCSSFRGYLICYYNGEYNPGSGALGNLTLTNNLLSAEGQRIILFVENASVTFAGPIKPQTGARGKSSFLVISEGGINISPTVGSQFLDTNTDLEGVFYTDGVFDSGTLKPGSDDINLHIRGSVVAGSFNLRRDLGSGAVGEKNDRHPAEYFEYGAEQVMAFPPFLRLRSTSWSEVAP